jgi:hypothetical protein
MGKLSGGFFGDKIKEQTIKELDTLAPDELLKMYDLIISLKNTHHKEKAHAPDSAEYLNVREALKACKGSLSEDLLLEQGDRI